MPRRNTPHEKVQRLSAFFREEKRMPGYGEMLDLFEYRSKNSVYGLLQKLKDQGYIHKTGDGKIAPTSRLIGGVKLLGSVQAGFPSPAEEELVDVLSLDEYLVRRPEATFMLTVNGDSMLDAGIHPGDIVLVERGEPPQSGDIVVAQVDGEWTIKYFRKVRNKARLEAANAHYAPIEPRHSLVIGGIVKAVVRKYR